MASSADGRWPRELCSRIRLYSRWACVASYPSWEAYLRAAPYLALSSPLARLGRGGAPPATNDLVPAPAIHRLPAQPLQVLPALCS